MVFVIPTRDVRLATFNLHEFVGTDGRRDAERCRAIVAALAADIVAVQEFRKPTPDHAEDELETWGRALDMTPIAGFTLRDDRGDYGNALFTRLPVRSVQSHDLSRSRREPRGAIDVEVEWGEQPLRVLATHLGLSWKERQWQIARLLELIGIDPQGPTVLLADTNDWSPGGLQLRALRRALPRITRSRTFPARRPILRLDRIAASADLHLEEERAPVDRSLAHASDHLPLVARVAPGATQQAAGLVSPSEAAPSRSR
jgi:endonuclease/exonuclease/phosphatase family metal-dependent hydrolase